MRRAGKVVAEMHEATRAAARPGVTTAELDKVAREVLERRGATSNFLGYHGFPAVICTSPNSMIVHGIPGAYVLEEGDILSIDCGAIIEGYHGDAAFTMGIGSISKEAQKLLEVTERSLWAGIDQLVKGNALHEVGPRRPERGRGRRLHASCASTSATPSAPRCTSSPRSPTTGRAARARRSRRATCSPSSPWSTPAAPETVLLDDGWSVVTADGKLSAHFEHTIAVTDDGPEVFTVA